MNKKKLLFLSFLIGVLVVFAKPGFAKPVFAQNDTISSKNGVVFSAAISFAAAPYAYNLNYDRLYFKPIQEFDYWNSFYEIDPTFGIHYKQHSLYVGPKFWLWQKGHFYSEWQTRGFRTTYQYNLKKEPSRLKYHLFYEIMLAEFAFPVGIKSITIIHWNNVIGAGFNYNIFANFYVNSQFGFGIHLYKKNVVDFYGFESKGNIFSHGEMSSFL